jgi:Mrp family chromosome partitioning ATPase/predicted Fe-Mo cluster-binding NifX family protein
MATSCNSCTSESCAAKGGQDSAELEQCQQAQALKEQLGCIKHKILVFSGKGGVGKSTVSANLAMSLVMEGYRVGLLDIDFHGPSIPTLFGLADKRAVMSGEKLAPLSPVSNLLIMSIGFLLDNVDDAVIWRGPMKIGVIQQLLRDVEWGQLDYLIIDSPPGTGDEPLSVVQTIEDADGAVLVTTPQQLAIADVRKSVSFCKKVNLPVLGVIENMSGVVCPKCGETIDMLKQGGGEAMCEDMGVPFLGRIPMDPAVMQACDEGRSFVYHFSKTETAKAFQAAVDKLQEGLGAQAPGETAESAASGSARFAIPLAEGKLAMHFGHCAQFALVDVDLATNRVLNIEMITPPPHEPGLLPKFLGEKSVTTIIAGGMGSRAQQLFNENGIQVVTGASVDTPENLVASYLGGTLETGENGCDH